MGEYVVEWYSTPAGKEVVIKEMRKLLTDRQQAHVVRQLGRVEAHGRKVGNNYFGRVKTSEDGLEELRLSADRVEVRFLFADIAPLADRAAVTVEPVEAAQDVGRVRAPRTLLLLTCYKEQSGGIPDSKIRAAEKRLAEWRSRA